MTAPAFVVGATTKQDPSATTSRDITKPTYSSGDEIFLFVVASIASANVASSGFTPLPNYGPATLSGGEIWILSKPAASEPATYTITSSSCILSVIAVAVSNYGGIHAVGTNATGTGSTATAPAVVTTLANTLRVSVIATDDNPGVTSVATLSGHTLLTTVTGANKPTVSVQWKALSGTGSDASQTAVLSGSETWTGLAFVIYDLAEARVTKAGAYVEVLDAQVNVTKAGIYLELINNQVRVTQAGAYVEILETQGVRATALGAYIELVEAPPTEFVQATALGAYVELVEAAPTAPTLLTAVTVSDSRIDLAWQDNSTGELGFKVERSLDGSTGWTQIGTSGLSVTTYSDTGLAAATTYYYRVRAYNAGGDSDYSNVASATTFAATVTGGATRTWSIELYDRAFDPAAPSNLTLRTLRYSIHAVGGYEYAEIAIDGNALELWEALRWLRYYVIIRNGNHTPVWCGFVTEATIDLGGISIGKSLDTMTNRIAVAYTYDDANGQPVRGTTTWADNLTTQGKYGVIEYLESQGDMTESEAEALRDRALDIYGNPPTVVSVNESTVGGTLRCKGLWDTLAWKLYNRPGGLEQYEETGAYEHLLGWGFTSSVVAFNEWVDKIHTMDKRLGALRENDYIVVTGASNGANNDTHRVKVRSTKDPESYTNTTIAFNTTDDITDSAALMGFIEDYELVNVSGSAVGGNNRYYITKSDVGGEAITVNPATVANSSAGSTVTIAQGHSVELDATLVTEYPSATVTVKALGTVLAQSFTLSVDDPFVVSEVFIRVKRVGNPVDSLSVAIRDDVTGEPDTVSLESVTTLGSTIGDQTTWLRIEFSSTVALTYGVDYWLLCARTGSNDHENYYMVELNEDAGYTGGVLKLWDGAAWVDRPVPPDGPATAEMPFQIWSWRETSAQLDDMLTDSEQLFDGWEIRTASGVYKRQYRDQDQTAKTEIENLLAVGTSNGRRYLARVTPERIAQIYQEPAADSNADVMLTIDGTLQDVSGNPLEDGRLPVGQWVQIAGVPLSVDEVERVSPIFVERAEYNPDLGKFSALETKGAPNPWDEVRIRDGAAVLAQRIRPHIT